MSKRCCVSDGCTLPSAAKAAEAKIRAKDAITVRSNQIRMILSYKALLANNNYPLDSALNSIGIGLPTQNKAGRRVQCEMGYFRDAGSPAPLPSRPDIQTPSRPPWAKN